MWARLTCTVVGWSALAFLSPPPVSAQYAETPRVIGAANDMLTSATQIGRRLFVGGPFTEWSASTGGAVVVTPTGVYVPGGFPRFAGTVHHIVPDGVGGNLVAGDFTSVDGLPIAYFARVGADGRIDPRVRIAADGAVRLIALAHGRVYLAGDFTVIDGRRRRGLAALDVATGRVSTWGSGFDPDGRRVIALSASSIGVYLSAQRLGIDGRVWGLDAAAGHVLFSRVAIVNAIAATSARVYVGGNGHRRPVWAIDPLNGQDTPWSMRLAFLPLQSGLYGETTTMQALLVSEGRLYFGGWFRTTDTRVNLASVEADDGRPVGWRAEGIYSTITGLVRVGQEIVAIYPTFLDQRFGRRVMAFNVDSGALHPWDPQPYGPIHTVAAASNGAVVGGAFDGMGGVARPGLAAVDLDTGALEPWAPAVPSAFRAYHLEADGSSVIAWSTSQALKIDADSGAVLASLDVDTYITASRVVDGHLLLVYSHPTQGPTITVVTIADWSRRDVPVVFSDPTRDTVGAIDAVGDVIYLAGSFTYVNGAPRRALAAIRMSTGEVLPWNPSPDGWAWQLRAALGHIWVGGDFRRVGGSRRRGLAALDPLTGRATTWNPDVPVGVYDPHGNVGSLSIGVSSLDVGPDGLVYAGVYGLPYPVVSGQRTPAMVAMSPVTGRRLPWRPRGQAVVALLPDCLMFDLGCLPRAIAAPTDIAVEQNGAAITLRWRTPVTEPTPSGARVELGSAEGLVDVAQLDLPASQTAVSAVVPPGAYVARVRSLAGESASLPSPDVSFVVGPPDVPAAPLDVTAVTEGARLTVAWRPPSAGTPSGYVFEAGTAPGRRDVAALPLVGTATSFTLDAPQGRYFGRLVPFNSTGRGVASAEVLIDVSATRGGCRTGPDAPIGLTATVTGPTVQLSWQQPDTGELAEAQHVIVGSGPGASDLGTFEVDGPATSFSRTAPSGVYYVRVAGANSCGTGPASNEVQVEVR